MNLYSPGLFGLNITSTFIFIVIPVVSVLSVFLVKRKFLWTAPIISTLLVILFSVSISGITLLTEEEYRGMFLVFIVPIQFVIVTLLTVILYLVLYVIKRRKNK